MHTRYVLWMGSKVMGYSLSESILLSPSMGSSSMRGASTNFDLVVCQPALATICSAVAMLMVNTLCSMMLGVVLWPALIHKLSSWSSLMPPQAAFMALGTPSLL